MVPIHDTDVASERWSKAEWENYELWEKVEGRLNRQKRWWIIATAVLFVILSALPIVMDRWPKWMTRAIVRTIAQEINQVKREASVHRAAYRFRLAEDGRLDFLVERVANCTSAQALEVVRRGSISSNSVQEEYYWMDSKKGTEQGVPGLVNEFCYDYLAGSGAHLQHQEVIGFAVIPVKDLPEKRIDRLSVLLLSGPSAEISFD